MQEYKRYAIYYAPERGAPLGAFGNSWLGIDPETGEGLSRPAVAGWSEKQLIEATSSPSRYGFHGTLKPPFALNVGYSCGELDRALKDLSGHLRGIVTGPLTLRRIGHFLCLCPTGPLDRLNNLSAEIVAGLDQFRAPQSEAQLAKRRARGLTDRQEKYLQQYGYPYVMDEFRFHLTLSNSLDGEQLEQLQETLEELTAPYTAEAFQIRELCLFADPGEGEPFKLLKRYPLADADQ